MTAPSRILYLEDDVDLRSVLSAVLSREGFAVTAVSCAEEALELLGTEKYDVMLTDYRLEGEHAPWLLRKANARGFLTTMPVVVLSSEENPPGVEGHLYLQKPVDFELLGRALATMLTTRLGMIEADAAATKAAGRRADRIRATIARSRRLAQKLAVQIQSFEARLAGWAFPITATPVRGLAVA